MIRKNVASQTVYLPQLRLTADGSAVTTGASLVVAKDGVEAAAAGTLDHYAGGIWKYTPTQGETNCAIMALVLTATGADTVLLNILTTAANPQDATAFGIGNLDGTISSRSSQTSVDTLAGYVDTEVAAIKAKTDNLPVDPADASDIAASFSTVNSTLATISGYIDTEVAAIKAKTDNLPASPAAVGSAMTLTVAYDAAKTASTQTSVDTLATYVDTEVAAIKAKTDNLPVDPADASDIAASFATVNSTLATIAGYIDTEVAAIKAKTDNLPIDPADASDIAASFASLTSLVNTLTGYVDTEVAAIKAKTDNLPAQPAAVSDIPTVGQVADGVWDEVLTGATHNIASSAGRRLRQLASVIVRAGTAQGPGTGNNQIQLDAGASSTNGDYDPGLIFIETGTGAGQARLILQYNGSTKVATVDRDWRVNPDSTSEFVILADAGRQSVNEGLAQAGSSTTITLNTSASSNDDAYNGQLIFIRSGTGQDQVALVEDYVGSTKVATIRTRSATGQWAVVPDTTSAYVMIPNLTFTVAEIAAAVAEEPLAGHTTAGTLGKVLSDAGSGISTLLGRITSTVYTMFTDLVQMIVNDGTVSAQWSSTAMQNVPVAGGSGARSVTITVRDSSSNPIQNASVRVYRTGESFILSTNASGVAAFSLDDATWTVAITATGFSFTPASLVISANTSQTYTMTTAGGGVTPSEPPFCTGYFVVYDQNGTVQAGAQVSIQASSPPVGSTGIVMEDAVRTATADNNGVVQFSNLIKGSVYVVWRTGSSRKFNITVPANAGNTQPLASIVG